MEAYYVAHGQVPVPLTLTQCPNKYVKKKKTIWNRY